MSGAFWGCSKLETLDLDNWNTENVENVSNLFYGCSNLSILKIDNWNTQNIKKMDWMFTDCCYLSSEITLNMQNMPSVSLCFRGTSSKPGTMFILKYTDDKTKEIAKKLIETKYSDSHIFIEGEYKDFSQCTVTLNKDEYEYTGEKIYPNIIVKDGDKELKAYENYRVTFIDNINPGTATIILDGIGEYGGYIKKTFKIKEKEIFTVIKDEIESADEGETINASVDE